MQYISDKSFVVHRPNCFAGQRLQGILFNHANLLDIYVFKNIECLENHTYAVLVVSNSTEIV